MIPAGYKQTEIGVIPEDWSSKKIKTFAKICMCKRVFADQTTEIGEIPFYKIGTFGGKPDAYISKRLFNDYREKYSYPTKGDILISAAGTLGRSVVFDGTDSYFQDSNIVWLDINKAQICNEFLRYYYEVIKWSAAEGSTISRLYNGIIENTCVAIPPLPEQRRIAEALSDVDELIASLEKLIEKKKALKQGVMQELLTGKRRLPGFSGEWKEQPLDKYGEFIRGVSYDPNVDLALFDNGSVCKLLRANNIVDNDLDIHEVLFVSNKCVSPKQKLQKGDIVIAMSSGSTIAIGKNAQYLHDFDDYCVGAFCAVFRSEISDYISYIFQSNMFRKQLSELLEGTSINNLNGTILGKMTFPFSDNNDERKGVCSVLDNIAKEINSLKDQQNKYKKIKSGMMSELLTGRIRLV